MSVSLYRWTEECEQDPMCVGDCDLCRKETMEDKYNEAGIPTDALEYADGVNLAMTGNATAKPASACIYPQCEKCDKYHGHYCTVPMVVSKQNWLTTEAAIARLEKRVSELEYLVADEILKPSKKGVVSREEKLNYTWADYFEEEDQ